MKKSILVVEDDEVYRELIVRLLGDEYALQFASSIRGASEVFESHTPDCVLLDMRLPDGDGIEFLPKPLEARVPVIMCTAYGNEALAVRALKEGAEDYLVKNSLSKLELRRAVNGAIEQARLQALLRLREAEKDALIKQLQAALGDVETLRGIIPICASCKKIRDDEGYWHMVETYVSEHTGASFTHGLCPGCLQREMDQLAADDSKRGENEEEERQ